MSISVNTVSHRTRNFGADAGIGMVAGGLLGLGVGKLAAAASKQAATAGVVSHTAFRGAGIGMLVGAAGFILADDAISQLKGRPVAASMTGGLGALTGAAAGAAIGKFTPFGVKGGIVAGAVVGGLVGTASGDIVGKSFPGASNSILSRTGIGVGVGAIGGGVAGAVLGATVFKSMGIVPAAIWGAGFGAGGGLGYGALNVN